MNRMAANHPEDWEDRIEAMRDLQDRHDSLEPCLVCGEELTRGGRTCRRCQQSIEYDRLERESNR